MQTRVAPGGNYFGYEQDAPEVAAAGKDNTSSQHFSGGIFGGYEHSFNTILIGGGEVSVNNLSINHSHSSTAIFTSDPTIQFMVSQSLKTNWQGTLRLRLGLAQPRWLAYLTGGAAMTYIKYKSSYSDDNEQPGTGNPELLTGVPDDQISAYH